MSTLLYNQSNKLAEMKISMDGVLFNRNSINNSVYKRAKEAYVAGIFCLLVPMMFTFFCIAKDILLDSFNMYSNIMITSGLLFRVIALNWVSHLLSKQHSSVKVWQVLTFLIPSVTLIMLSKAVRKQPSLFDAAKSEKMISAVAEVIDYEFEYETETYRKAI